MTLQFWAGFSVIMAFVFVGVHLMQRYGSRQVKAALDSIRFEDWLVCTLIGLACYLAIML